MTERKPSLKTKLGLAAVSFALVLEGCSPGNNQEKIAGDFVGALISGDTNGAINYLPPDARSNRNATGRVSDLTKIPKGCQIDKVTKGQMELQGSAEVRVTFKQPCGNFGALGKASSSSVFIDKQGYVNIDLTGFNPSYQ